ncbi:hypothetical protein NFJ02_17g27660 [Pycnococcus provasolii]
MASAPHHQKKTILLEDVAASLEQAAENVKQMTEFAGAQEIKTSVDLLTAQVQTLHGTLAKNHADVMEHSKKILEATEKLTTNQSNEQRLSRLAIQAQAHNRMAYHVEDTCLSRGSHSVSDIDKQIVVSVAKFYGWKIGDKNVQYGRTESDEEQIIRRWNDALACLKCVTLPSMKYGGAAYYNFVR